MEKQVKVAFGPASEPVKATVSMEKGELPALPADASTSTYVLKVVNGTLTWVKETV